MTNTELLLLSMGVLVLGAAAVTYWIFRPKNADRMEHDARLPLDDDERGD